MRGYDLLAILTCSGLITLLPCCTGKACPWMTFGPHCQFQCHCAENHRCHKIDGACAPYQRCAGGWFGPACQFKDYAYDAKSYPINSPQRGIKDGKETSCNVFFDSDHTTIHFDPPIKFAWMRFVNDYGGTSEVKLSATANGEVLKPKGTIHPVTSFGKVWKGRRWVSDYYGDFGKEIDSLTLNFGRKGVQVCSINVATRRGHTAQQFADDTDHVNDMSAIYILVGSLVAGVMGIAILVIVTIYLGKRFSASTGESPDVQAQQQAPQLEGVETPEPAQPEEAGPPQSMNEGGPGQSRSFDEERASQRQSFNERRARQSQSLTEGRIGQPRPLNQGGKTETLV